MSAPDNVAAATRLATLINGHIQSQLVGVAAKLEIPDILADGPVAADVVATRSGLSLRTAYRLLRGLVMCGLASHRDDDRFELAPMGRCLTRRGSLHHAAVNAHDVDYPIWGALLHGLRTGDVPFVSVFGRSFFEHVNADTERARTFNRLLDAFARRDASLLSESYAFTGLETFVDVGGGTGVLMAAILKAFPRLHGTLIDVEPAANEARERMHSEAVGERAVIISGDFFRVVPESADLYLLKHVLHNWDDLHCVRLLIRCRDAMTERSRLLVMERLMSERVTLNDAAVSADLFMFVSVGGAERTITEFRGLFEQAGLRFCRVVHRDERVAILEVARAD